MRKKNPITRKNTVVKAAVVEGTIGKKKRGMKATFVNNESDVARRGKGTNTKILKIGINEVKTADTLYGVVKKRNKGVIKKVLTNSGAILVSPKPRNSVDIEKVLEVIDIKALNSKHKTSREKAIKLINEAEVSLGAETRKWLYSKTNRLNGELPIQLIIKGKYQAVTDAIKSIELGLPE